MIQPEGHETLGATVRRRRRELNLLQSQVAQMAEVSERLVREVEHDKPSLRLDTLRRVLAVLGLELRAEVRRV